MGLISGFIFSMFSALDEQICALMPFIFIDIVGSTCIFNIFIVAGSARGGKPRAESRDPVSKRRLAFAPENDYLPLFSSTSWPKILSIFVFINIAGVTT